MEPTKYLVIDFGFDRPRHEVGKSTRTKHEVKYPIRSGPKQFTAYLKGMIFFKFLINIEILCLFDKCFYERNLL